MCNVLVHCPVKFPCPYNVDVEIGDIRVYPRTYERTNAGVCKYRGARWKNVLDHLAFCKANPKKEKYHAAKEARQAKSKGEFQCDQCDHPPFVLKNSLVQHRTRKHPGRGPLLPPAYLQITFLANEDITPYDTVDESLDWLLLPEPSDHEEEHPPSKRKKLQRRQVAGSSADSKHEEGSLLEQFDYCISSASDVELESHLDDGGLMAYSPTRSYGIVTELLKDISQSDVRQPRGRMELNVGEMTYQGVTDILSCFGDVEPGDVFADVGAGVGNVVIQVALQTRFELSVGVEVRDELTSLTTAILEKHKITEPRLTKIRVVTADITLTDVALDHDVARVTHLFSHNTLFTPDAIVALEDLCWLPKLRKIAITLLPCHRHRNLCKKSFCRLWTLQSTIRVPVTYKDSPVDVYVFTKAGSFL